MSTPARSAKDAWANLSSSATKRKSSTTPTIILDHNVEIGKRQTPPAGPRDPTEQPAHRNPPRAVTADRATARHPPNASTKFGRPPRGDPAPDQTQRRAPRSRTRRAFRDNIKWRTVPNGRINRTELTGIHGVRAGCGHGVFAHNLLKIGALTQQETSPRVAPHRHAHTHQPPPLTPSVRRGVVLGRSSYLCHEA
jgi:transposase, IS5 family